MTGGSRRDFGDIERCDVLSNDDRVEYREQEG
jgi:hypothetical protein